LNAANRALVEEINKATAVQLSMANALWAQKVFPMNPSFSQTLESAYSAQAKNLGFRDPKSVGTINARAAKHTNGRIQEILSPFAPFEVIANATAMMVGEMKTLSPGCSDHRPRSTSNPNCA
jgi:serine protease inhibitor